MLTPMRHMNHGVAHAAVAGMGQPTRSGTYSVNSRTLSARKQLDRLPWAVFLLVMATLFVLAISDQPMLLIIVPAALAGPYALLALIVRLLGGQRRPERDRR
jgi:cobalamin synthase